MQVVDVACHSFTAVHWLRTSFFSHSQQGLLHFIKVNVIWAALHNDEHAPLEEPDGSSKNEDGKNESANRVTPPPFRLEIDND